MNQRFVAVVALLLMAVTLAAPLAQSDASADEKDVSIIYREDSVTLKAGDTYEVDIVVYNILVDDPGVIDGRVVYINASSDDPLVTCRVTNPQMTIPPAEYREGKISITADPYAHTGTVQITVSLKIIDPEDNTSVTGSKTFEVEIQSSFSAGNAYNKILGIWASPLPAPFNEPIYTALVSFVLFVVIGLVIGWVVVPLVLYTAFRKNKEGRTEIVEKTSKLIFGLIFVYGTVQCLRIYGAPEQIVGIAMMVSNVLYVVVGAMIAWSVYSVAVKFVFHNVINNVDVDGVDDSLVPLFKMIGKITIAVIAVAGIMASLGFNLMAIVTGAGIVGLAISLGAQSMLQQFFSGLTLLMTRPFKAGDLVRLGNDTAVLRVRRVGIMNSVFENWENAEVFSLPNNSVTSGKIVNITGESRAYRILVYMDIAYGADVDRAKEIMYDVAMEHPQVIKDGSYDRPATRITSFKDSAIEVRLAVYVNEFEDYGVIGGQLRERIYKRFVDESIVIPFPQVDVHIVRDNE